MLILFYLAGLVQGCSNHHEHSGGIKEDLFFTVSKSWQGNVLDIKTNQLSAFRLPLNKNL